MRGLFVAGGLLAVLLGNPGASVGAEQSLPGTYRGAMTTFTRHGQVQTGIDLVIDSAENGVVRATMVRYNMRAKSGGACNGRYEMHGTYAGNTLKLRAAGGARECSFEFTAVLEDGKLVGTGRSGQRIELAR